MSGAVGASDSLAEDLDHIFAHTAGLWEQLRGKNIFITGGTGFFGRWLLESFADANRRLSLGARTVVLSRNPEPFRSAAPHLGQNAGIEFVRGDVRQFTPDDVLSQVSTSGGFEFVIHAATESNSLLNVENPRLMLETVVDGTRAALEFAVAAGARRLLLTSSGAVYGAQPPELSHVRDDYRGGPDTMNASSAYAEGKRAAEVLCACYAKEHDIEPVIARCFAFFGPHQPLDAHLATVNFIRDALGGGPIRVTGSGADVRSYMYAADLAIWLWTLLFRGTAGRVYNVGSEQSVTIAEWARAIAAVLAPASAVEIATAPASERAASRYVPSTERAREELGLNEWISREDGLRRFARWYRGTEACRAGEFG